MKNLKSLAAFIMSVVMLGSCNSDENFVTPAGSGERASMHLKLGGSVKTAAPQSRAGIIASETDERTVNKLHAILFDTEKGFYKTVEARPTTEGEYDIPVLDDATYDVWFVANADADLVEKLEQIPSSTQAEDAYEYLQTVYATQQPKSEAGFLMHGESHKTVTTSITKTSDLGTIYMMRLAARFDIVNKAKDITVDKITFTNRAVKSTLYRSNTMPEEEGWFETTTYTPTNLKGDEENPAAYSREIYSYRNTSMEAESVPVITLEYTESVDGKDVKRSHDVRLIDPNAPAGTPLAVQSNYLYTITLTKAYKLEFNLTVNDWNEAETFNVTDLPVDLGEEEPEPEEPDESTMTQEELNKRLLVYDLFAEYNVKYYNYLKQVAFFTELVDGNKYPMAGLPFGSTLLKDGIFNNNHSFNVEGEKYRVPTKGELQLLTPERAISFDASETSSTSSFTEVVYLKNDKDHYPLITDDFSDESIAFKGTSQIKRGNKTYERYFDSTFDWILTFDKGPTYGRLISIAPVYGIRFKGSQQYAAYKWEYAMIENGIFYNSIKIKALPMDSELTIDDITDNESYWNEGFIEIKLPLTSRREKGAENTTGYYTMNLHSSTLVKTLSEHNYYFNTYRANMQISSGNDGYGLRLVKIKE